ncbi:hypothetical protein [Candidatus Accumulibacter sp. ACC007]|uniref:hypothetical protein n=1 Tax=Candidatus Accumulibacter sp. ACC007 TaxID=2823333 RepID=UPI0025BE4EC2|nr:hypothetical protein [Candidatus Accumulibacter sp. ACC007]
MSKLSGIKPTPRQAMEWVKEVGNGQRRLVFSEQAEARMKHRYIGRRQVLETLKNGLVSEPLHKDAGDDWRCNLSWFHAGARLTVGVIFKLGDAQEGGEGGNGGAGGELAVVATVVEG